MIKALSRFPTAGLLCYSTLVHSLPRLNRAIPGGQILIKRDDVMTLAFGGNKVRQLDYYLGEALSKKADTVLITGAVQSNFARLTAAACCRLGLACHVQLESRVANQSALYQFSGNVLLNRIFGANFHYYNNGEDEEGADAALRDIAIHLTNQGKKPYIIYLGPNHKPLGALGYVRAAHEIISQLNNQPAAVKRIFVASGSGNTHAGLIFGLRLCGSHIPVEGICVRRPAGLQFPRIQKHCWQIAALINVKNPVTDKDILLNDSYLPPGYGSMGQAAKNALRTLAEYEGILTDPVYTAKVMAACLNWASQKSPQDTALFIHTGGTPAIFGYGDSLYPELKF